MLYSSAQRDHGPASASDERRASPRIRTVFFVVRITRDADAGLFLVRNISDLGMNVVAHVPMTVGERLSIALSESVSVTGSVAWCEGRFCGVEFDAPIDCGYHLRSLAGAKRSHRRAAMRLPVMKRATSYSQAGIHSVTVTDVSPRGVGLAHSGAIRPGMFIRLVLESGATRRGAVCWSKNGHAGVLLGEPFTLEELESASNL
jgi:hypothetical protein